MALAQKGRPHVSRVAAGHQPEIQETVGDVCPSQRSPRELRREWRFVQLELESAYGGDPSAARDLMLDHSPTTLQIFQSAGPAKAAEDMKPKWQAQARERGAEP